MTEATPRRSPSARDGDEEHAHLGARLREAREYVGLLQEEVATALQIPRASVSALESGKRKVSGVELRELARLYHRSVDWLLGAESTLGDVEPLFRATAQLSDYDRDQVLRFAEFLASAGRPTTTDVQAAGESRARRPAKDQ